MYDCQVKEFDLYYIDYQGFSDSSVGKESSCNAGDPGSIPGSGRSPEEGDPLEKGSATHSSILGLFLWLS